MNKQSKHTEFGTVKSFFYKWKLLKFIWEIRIPGFGGVAFTEVIQFFYTRLVKESIVLRASASAFSFFLALFPALIFLFTLIPYVPIPNLQLEVTSMMKQYMPANTFQTIEATLTDILLNRRGNLLSLGFVLTIYFASNGVNTLLAAFNRELRRRWYKKYMISITLTFVLAMMIFVAMTFQIVGEILISYFKDSFLFGESWIVNLIWFFKLLITLLLSITAISLLYFYSSTKNESFKFYSPGAFVATLLILLVSYGFGFYVDHFAQYNRLYGSLGAIIVLLIWLYLSALSLISGFEFNQSIVKAQQKQRIKYAKLELMDIDEVDEKEDNL